MVGARADWEPGRLAQQKTRPGICLGAFQGCRHGLSRRQTTLFLWKRTCFAIKGCYIWLDSRPPTTTSGWTTFPTGYCNSEIQDGVQDGRHILKSPYYHRVLLYFMCNTSFLWFLRSGSNGLYLWCLQSDLMWFEMMRNEWWMTYKNE